MSRSERFVIYRVLENGVDELFTETELTLIGTDVDWGVFEEFAKQLGENILMDSPAARKLFRLS